MVFSRDEKTDKDSSHREGVECFRHCSSSSSGSVVGSNNAVCRDTKNTAVGV